MLPSVFINKLNDLCVCFCSMMTIYEIHLCWLNDWDWHRLVSVYLDYVFEYFVYFGSRSRSVSVERAVSSLIIA